MKVVYNKGMNKQNTKALPIQFSEYISQNDAPTRFSDVQCHDYIEIFYVKRGSFAVKINETEYLSEEGGMCVVNAREPHLVRGVTGKRSMLSIKFSPQILISLEQTVTETGCSLPFIFGQFGSKRVFTKEELANDKIQVIFDEILKENNEKRFGYELTMRADIMKIFCFIMRFWHESNDIKQLPQFNTAAAKIIKNTRKYIEENYVDATLSGAAEYVGLSYSYFSRVFNSYFGMSFSNYLNLVRVNESLKLLVNDEMDITEVALTVGFTSTSYYIHTFKKIKNISPNHFRTLLKRTSYKV
jgi:AraC-like DNA-binding protein/mannose-6-phosphate isomerase-like protein (cupin superfamily)